MPAGFRKGPDYSDPRATLHAAVKYIRDEADWLGMPRIARALDHVVAMLQEMMVEVPVDDPNEKNDRP